MSRWQEDADVTRCNSCRAVFGVIVRRHHCRACGWLFCGDCSDNFLLIPEKHYISNPSRIVIFGEDHKEPVRCCDDCAEQLERHQPSLQKQISPYNKTIDTDDRGWLGQFRLPYFSSLSDEIIRAGQILQKFREVVCKCLCLIF